MNQRSLRAEFLSNRGGSNVWARSATNIAAWRRGSLDDVRPLSLEYAPILSCNARCAGHCSYHGQRRDAGNGHVAWGEYAPLDDKTASTVETAMQVIDACADAGILGVLWTGGGEPTIWRPLVDLLRYSASKGLTNALYTNGFQLGIEPRLAEQLLRPENGLAFVRVSVNTATPKITAKHWTLSDARKVLLAQRAGVDRLLRARSQLLSDYEAAHRPVPSLAISTIVDERNCDDLLDVCKSVAEIYGHHPEFRGMEDIMVVRPITDHRREVYSTSDRQPKVIRTILDVCGSGGIGRGIVESANLRLDLGFGLDLIDQGQLATYADVLRRQYAERDYCWAHGLFLTVGPDASVYPCTELNCAPEWSIGNLKYQTVEAVFRSDRRREFLRLAHSIRWGPQIFQPQGRTARLDRIAEAIASGDFSDDDILVIRQESMKSHSLLLN